MSDAARGTATRRDGVRQGATQGDYPRRPETQENGSRMLLAAAYRLGMRDEEWIEDWRWIPGWEGFYKVSSAGGIISAPRIVKDRWQPRPNRRVGGRVLKTRVYRDYARVVLCRDAVAKPVTVHSLVALAFLGAPPEGCWVLHNNGDSLDNVVSNLRHGTPAENQADMRRHMSEMRALDPEEHGWLEPYVGDIREDRRRGLSYRALSDIYGATPVAMKAAAKGVLFPQAARPCRW